MDKNTMIVAVVAIIAILVTTVLLLSKSPSTSPTYYPSNTPSIGTQDLISSPPAEPAADGEFMLIAHFGKEDPRTSYEIIPDTVVTVYAPTQQETISPGKYRKYFNVQEVLHACVTASANEVNDVECRLKEYHNDVLATTYTMSSLRGTSWTYMDLPLYCAIQNWGSSFEVDTSIYGSMPSVAMRIRYDYECEHLPTGHKQIGSLTVNVMEEQY